MQDMMNAADIAFPNLGIYLENVPKSFTVFGFMIAFYGVIIGIGLMAGFALALHEAKRTGQDPELYWDFILIALFASLIGARIYYVIFAWDIYKNNLLEIFHFRSGGLAIYGAVIAACITLFIYARVKKQSFLRMADTAVPGLILGQIIGRWGNFMNREAFGDYTDGLLAMRLPIAAVRAGEITENMAGHITEGINYVQVHPTFLYESLWNLGVLTIMMLYRKYKRFEGELLLLYLGGYGIGRFWIEGLRTDQLRLGHTDIAVSQVLGLCLFLFAVVLDVLMRVKLAKQNKTV